MKKICLITMLLTFCLVGVKAQTQERNVTEGPVWRVSYLKTKPGKGADHTKWIREYRMKILDGNKQAGLIMDYKFYSKPVFDTTNDWDILEAVQYRNYGLALDFDETRSSKGNEISLKVFGTVENRTKIWAELRDASRDVIASHLIREMIFKPAN